MKTLLVPAIILLIGAFIITVGKAYREANRGRRNAWSCWDIYRGAQSSCDQKSNLTGELGPADEKIP